jgi:hypothetical protein
VWVWVHAHLCVRVRVWEGTLRGPPACLSPLFALLVGRCCLCGMNAQLSQGFPGACNMLRATPSQSLLETSSHTWTSRRCLPFRPTAFT